MTCLYFASPSAMNLNIFSSQRFVDPIDYLNFNIEIEGRLTQSNKVT